MSTSRSSAPTVPVSVCVPKTFATSRCCGVTYSKKTKSFETCSESSKMEEGFLFCSEKHRRFVERANGKDFMNMLFNAGVVVNAVHPEWRQEFYASLVMAIQLNTARYVGRPLIIMCEQDDFETVSKNLLDQLTSTTNFLDKAIDELEQLQRIFSFMVPTMKAVADIVSSADGIPAIGKSVCHTCFLDGLSYRFY
jgi:hypothetical protein